MTNMPPRNVGKVQSATVSALGYSGLSANGDTTGAIPEAYVNANVRAGTVPYAAAEPGHSDPKKVTLGSVGTVAQWQGWASATLTRSHQHRSSGKAVTETPKIKTEVPLVFVIRRVNERWKRALGFGLGGAGVGTIASPGIGTIGGLLSGVAIGVAWPKQVNKVDWDSYNALVLEFDPVPGYTVKTRYYEITSPFQVIDSSSDLKGAWTTNCAQPAKLIQGSGGEELFQHSHTHLLDHRALNYGQLHSE